MVPRRRPMACAHRLLEQQSTAAAAAAWHSHSSTPAPDDLLLARPPTRPRCCRLYGAPHGGDRPRESSAGMSLSIAFGVRSAALV